MKTESYDYRVIDSGRISDARTITYSALAGYGRSCSRGEAYRKSSADPNIAALRAVTTTVRTEGGRGWSEDEHVSSLQMWSHSLQTWMTVEIIHPTVKSASSPTPEGF